MDDRRITAKMKKMKEVDTVPLRKRNRGKERQQGKESGN